MANTTFEPDWVSPPGDSIALLSEQHKVAHSDLAKRLRLSGQELRALLAGKRAVDDTLARALAEVFGSTHEFWLRRQTVFEQQAEKFKERVHPQDHLSWLKQFPVSDLVEGGWFNRTPSKLDQVAEILQFFNVPTVEVWQSQYSDVFNAVAYRTSASFESVPGSVAAWLRCCEIEAGKIECKPWNNKAFRAVLPTIKTLTRVKDPNKFIPDLQRLCAECGVALVVVKAPSGCRASGATRFLTATRAVLMLTSRHLTDDHFWFSFFHEAGHLLLHEERLFLEFDSGDSSMAVEEREANEFAENTLIPAKAALLKLTIELRAIVRFARDMGVSPGIVVGQLQHYGRIRQNHFNRLKERYSWEDEDRS